MFTAAPCVVTQTLNYPKAISSQMEKCWWATQQKQSVKIYSQYKVVTKYNAAQSPAYDWQEGEHGVWFHVYAACTISRQKPPYVIRNRSSG